MVAVRRAKGLKQFELARRAEMCAAQLCQIENGRVSPSFQVVERLASALDTDVPGLISGLKGRGGRKKASEGVSASVSPSDGYRSCRAIEPDAARAIALIAEEEKRLDGLVAARGVPLACTIALNRARLSYEGAGALLADELRADLGLGTVPVGDLRSILMFRGVRIHSVKLPKATASVLLWNVARGLPVIVLNDGNTRERNLYRLAYELASSCLFVSLGKIPLDESLPQHRFLTDFTAAFLMPGATMRSYVAATGLGPEDWTFDDLVGLKAHFGVSAESFALRLEEFGLISPARRLALRDRLRAYYKSHPKAMEPQPKGDWFATTSRRGK